MRHHFHRYPNLRVVSIDASAISGDRKAHAPSWMSRAKQMD